MSKGRFEKQYWDQFIIDIYFEFRLFQIGWNRNMAMTLFSLYLKVVIEFWKYLTRCQENWETSRSNLRTNWHIKKDWEWKLMHSYFEKYVRVECWTCLLPSNSFWKVMLYNFELFSNWIEYRSGLIKAKINAPRFLEIWSNRMQNIPVVFRFALKTNAI